MVGMLGNYQALAAIQKLALEQFFVATNQLHLFDGKAMQWQLISIAKDSHCSVCVAQVEEGIHD
ncbi:sulfur carrier protein adenylyltransferase ThiF [Vibrio ponticus]|nr:sulfur carrier protein adenylyltransferase ThiF [Vibrio ponticus]